MKLGLVVRLVLVAALLAASAMGSGVAPEQQDRFEVTVTGAEDVQLLNALGECCPCADSTMAEIPGCAGGVQLVLRNQPPQAAAWPRVRYAVGLNPAEELFLRVIGTGRPITIACERSGAAPPGETDVSLATARTGQILWWRIGRDSLGAQKSHGPTIRILSCDPRVSAALHEARGESFQLHVSGTTELTLRDPLGRVFPRRDSLTVDIPAANKIEGYMGRAATPEMGLYPQFVLGVPDPVEGSYALELTGTGRPLRVEWMIWRPDSAVGLGDHTRFGSADSVYGWRLSWNRSAAGARPQLKMERAPSRPVVPARPIPPTPRRIAR